MKWSKFQLGDRTWSERTFKVSFDVNKEAFDWIREVRKWTVKETADWIRHQLKTYGEGLFYLTLSYDPTYQDVPGGEPVGLLYLTQNPDESDVTCPVCLLT